MNRRTKIVVTIGPACMSEDMILRLQKSGMNIARLNLSHGTHEDHRLVFHRLRNAAQKTGIPLCILLDLQGPKIRIGNLPGGGIFLKKDQKVKLTTQTNSADAEEIPVDFADLPRSVRKGERVLLDDGALELRVEMVEGQQVIGRIMVGGLLKSRKGISLPDAPLDIAALTHKDENDLEFGLNLGVDAIAQSFVRNGADVQQLREKIIGINPEQEKIPIIAKLERPEAIRRLEEIMKTADGVMVARGDLGVEMSPQEVPIVQKRIIECANRNAKVVITATQMLESMIHSPRPTRAEASDIANAIFDGSDAVMLSGETAVGEYPLQAVEMMDAIIRQAEKHVNQWGHWRGPNIADSQGDETRFMSLAVRQLAQDRNVEAIVVFTMSGRTALHVSKTRPGVPILAFTPDICTYHRLGLFWGVIPYMVPKSTSLEEMLKDIDTILKKLNVVKAGRQVALTCGFPVATTNPTNLVLLHTVGRQ